MPKKNADPQSQKRTGKRSQKRSTPILSAVRSRFGISVLIAAVLPSIAMSAVVAYQISSGTMTMDRFWIAAGSVAAFTVIGSVFVASLLSRGITRQIDALSLVVDQLKAGNLRARVDVMNKDELGTLAHALNTLLDELGDLIQSRDERKRTEDEIKQLMSEVTEVASGNLMIEAQVGEGVTGGVADAINFMVAELRDLISNVMRSTAEVSGNAKEILGGASTIAAGSVAQAERIAEAANNITEIAGTSTKVASDAETLAARASVAIETSKKGASAVQNTIQGMGRIREQAQETALRIKRLGEGSQEIGEIVSLIGDIADRTSTLALNASIQSAAAGEAGRGFAVVAEEVERLAVRSAEATREIDSLIRRIQNETKEAVNAVEESTREIVNGSRLANEAGVTLTQVEGVSSELGLLLRGIASEARSQATKCEVMVDTMGDLSTVSRQTAEQTRGNADIVEQLAARSDKLRESVGTFQLPD